MITRTTSDYVRTDPVWKEFPDEDSRWRADPFEGFESSEWRYSTLGECIEAERGWYQEFNLLAFHISTHYGIPLHEMVCCAKRRAARWIRVGGMDFSADHKGCVTKRASR